MTATPETITATALTVNQLRKEGNLQEALSIASILMESDAGNLWNRRAMAWLGLEYLKQQPLDEAEITGWITRLLDLDMPGDDTVFWEQFRWRVGAILFKLAKKTDSAPCWLIPFLKSLPQQSGKAHSFVLRAMLKFPEGLPGLVTAWGWDQFIAQDFASEILPNGKHIPALAERTYSAVAKCYLEADPYPDNDVAIFIQELGSMSLQYPNWLYVLYYQALLLQKTRRTQEAKVVVMPFARRKPNEFWVWDLLGTLHADDAEIQKACYAKALCCKSPETFLLNVRQKMAALLIASNQWSAARVEIDTLYRTRVQNNWKIPGEVVRWMSSQEYLQSSLIKNNDELYTTLRQPADMLLRDPANRHQGVIWKVNGEKQTASFFVNEKTHGGFSYGRLGKTFNVGDPVELYLEKVNDGEMPYYRVTEVEHYQGACSATLLRTFEGRLRMTASIGFVGDVFIGPDLMVLLKTAECKGKAVKTYDHKRSTWGWKAFWLDQEL